MTVRDDRPPGFAWILIVGGACFAAGFVGPMVLVPSSNIGPLVGIIYTGPAGVALGAVLWVVFAILGPAARLQWRLLYGITAICVICILLWIVPGPKHAGDVVEGKVRSCAWPADLEAETVAHWERKVAETQWTKPRAGWREGMSAGLRVAPGVVMWVRVERRNRIMHHQRWWNRSQFAEGWEPGGDEIRLYDEGGSCDQYPAGRAIRGYVDAPYAVPFPNVWPPEELWFVLNAARLRMVPERWKDL